MSLENYKYAPRGFGAYLKEVVPFERLHSSARSFFCLVNNLSDNHISLLDAAGGNGKRYGSGLFQLSETPHRQVTYVLNDFLPESIREFIVNDRPLLPENIRCFSHLLDLTQSWSYPDSSFDAVMMTWALHWLGSYHQQAIEEMVRVMKPNGLGFITTYTPYDVLIKNQVFPKAMSPEDLKRIFPEADEIVESISSLQKKPIWIVKFDTFISGELQKNPNYVVVEKHSMSVMGKKILVGFNPSYIPRLLEKACCEIILHEQVRNIDFPNEYREGDRVNTLLYYIFRRLS